MFLIVLCFSLIRSVSSIYNSTWVSLDSRPLPSWYDQAKFGVYLHWGVFSVPGFSSDEFWQKWSSKEEKIMEYMYYNKPGRFSYAEFGGQFKAEFFKPDEWVDIINSSGAKYVVFNAKSEEGFAMWPSPYSWNWNSQDIGPEKDIIGDLFSYFRDKTELHLGVQYSLSEWFNPFFLRDKQRSFSTSFYIERKLHPEIRDLITKYQPDIFWASGDEEATDEYWKTKEFLSWLYTESSVSKNIVVNDKWGKGSKCKHGGVMSCGDYFMTEGATKGKFEVLFQIDKLSWGYRREASLNDFYNTKQLIAALVRTVSYGGNFVLNIGPSADGKISPLQEERLRSIGDWLSVNGEAIYDTFPWCFKNDTLNEDIWYTAKGSDTVTVYAIALDWPPTHKLLLGAVTPVANTEVSLLGFNETLSWMIENDTMIINLQNITKALLSTNWAWTFKLNNLKTSREHRNINS